MKVHELMNELAKMPAGMDVRVGNDDVFFTDTLRVYIDDSFQVIIHVDEIEPIKELSNE